MSLFDGARARAIRLEAGVCIEGLAAAAGVSPNTVRTAESGKHQPRPRVAAALAKALGVALRDLAVPGERPTLREIRHRLGLTQAEIARRVGLGRQMVSRVERGVGGVGSPHLWANAYELTPSQWMSAHRASQDLARKDVAIRTHRRRTRKGGRE
ncbi:helix-turn-helix domain-containing protein [Streptomyces triculaminicus]|uniref:helix-turn-helix domain-containing protein n=1 Tax=Streptomyces triculaminicus TaxID=2816232 RepID=UPI0037D14F90